MGEPRKGDSPTVVVEHGTNACTWGARLLAAVMAAAAATALARLRPIRLAVARGSWELGANMILLPSVDLMSFYPGFHRLHLVAIRAQGGRDYRRIQSAKVC